MKWARTISSSVVLTLTSVVGSDFIVPPYTAHRAGVLGRPQLAAAAGLFMLPTAAPQLIVGPLTGRVTRRIGSRVQLLIGVALMLSAYLSLTLAHHHAWQLLAATSALGLGVGFGLGALANLIVTAVDPRQTGIATAMNTVMRTLGGAFGAAIAAECLARRGSLDGDFALAFAICAGALTLGVVAVAAIPGERLGIHLPLLRGRRVTSPV